MRHLSIFPVFGLAVVCAITGPSCASLKKQWYVQFATDAPLPRTAERITIEVLNESGRPACDDCVRDFDLLHGSEAYFLERGAFSIGVADEGASVVRVRARLYRVRNAGLSKDKNARAIDVVARLPAFVAESTPFTAPTTFQFVDFRLPLGCFGHAPDLDKGTTCQVDASFNVFDGPEPTLTKDPPVLPRYLGSTTCTKEVPAKMACVGSGAFLQGDESYEALVFDYPTSPTIPMAIPENAALMLDIDEVTVGDVRGLLKTQKIAIPTDALTGPRALRSKGAAGSIDDACTFVGRDDNRNDAYPINCIGRDLASDVCKALGRRLPREYEWEFAAGNGVEETLYPWSIDTTNETRFNYDKDKDVCQHARVGRGRKEIAGESMKCPNSGTGLLPGGVELDVTGAGIHNMGGNVAEWVSDELGFYDEPCWVPLGRTGCQTATKRLDRRFVPYRGGSWARDPQASIAVGRFGQENGGPSPYIGFRCAITEDELP